MLKAREKRLNGGLAYTNPLTSVLANRNDAELEQAVEIIAYAVRWYFHMWATRKTKNRWSSFAKWQSYVSSWTFKDAWLSYWSGWLTFPFRFRAKTIWQMMTGTLYLFRKWWFQKEAK